MLLVAEKSSVSESSRLPVCDARMIPIGSRKYAHLLYRPQNSSTLSNDMTCCNCSFQSLALFCFEALSNHRILQVAPADTRGSVV